MPGIIIEKILTVVIALGGGWTAAGIVRRYDEGASPRYIVLALATIAMALWAYLTVPPSLLALSCCLGWALLALVCINLQVYRLPDILTLPLIVLGFLVTVRLPEVNLMDRMIGAAAGYGVFAGLAWLYPRQALGWAGRRFPHLSCWPVLVDLSGSPFVFCDQERAFTHLFHSVCQWLAHSG